jgi:hypothetical protein
MHCAFSEKTEPVEWALARYRNKNTRPQLVQTNGLLHASPGQRPGVIGTEEHSER